MPNINDSINKGRQYALVAEQKISGTYLNAVVYDVMDLPVGAMAIAGYLAVESHATGVATGGTAAIATTVTADIDLDLVSTGNPTGKFVDDLDLKVANVKQNFAVALALPPSTTKRTFTFTPTVSTGGGAAGVTGTFRLVVEYVLENRANEVQPTTP